MERQPNHNQEHERWPKHEQLIEELLPEPHSQTILYAKGMDVWKLVKELLEMANVIRISIWHNNRPLASIPVLYGGLASALFPFVSLFSMISLLALNCRIVVEKK